MGAKKKKKKKKTFSKEGANDIGREMRKKRRIRDARNRSIYSCCSTSK